MKEKSKMGPISAQKAWLVPWLDSCRRVSATHQQLMFVNLQQQWEANQRKPILGKVVHIYEVKRPTDACWKLKWALPFHGDILPFERKQWWKWLYSLTDTDLQIHSATRGTCRLNLKDLINIPHSCRWLNLLLQTLFGHLGASETSWLVDMKTCSFKHPALIYKCYPSHIQPLNECHSNISSLNSLLFIFSFIFQPLSALVTEIMLIFNCVGFESFFH